MLFQHWNDVWWESVFSGTVREYRKSWDFPRAGCLCGRLLYTGSVPAQYRPSVRYISPVWDRRLSILVARTVIPVRWQCYVTSPRRGGKACCIVSPGRRSIIKAGPPVTQTASLYIQSLEASRWPANCGQYLLKKLFRKVTLKSSREQLDRFPVHALHPHSYAVLCKIDILNQSYF